MKDKNGDEYIWKDGTTAGYRSIMLLNKTKKTGVVILANTLNPINDLAYHILSPTVPVKPYRYIWALHDLFWKQPKIKTLIKLLKNTKP